MKISINAILASCILCYFRYFLQLMLELFLILFILIGFLKKDFNRVEFDTDTQTAIY